MLLNSALNLRSPQQKAPSSYAAWQECRDPMAHSLSETQFWCLETDLLGRLTRVIRGFPLVITVSSGRWWPEASEGCCVVLREHQEILF